MSDSGSIPPPPDDGTSMRHTRIWLQVGSCSIAVFFFFTFVISPRKRWQASAAVTFLLTAVPALATTIFTQIVGMLLAYYDMSQLYLVWAVFLSIANANTVAATAYSIYDSSSTRIAFQMDELANNIYVAIFVGVFPVHDKIPLWVLWSFSMAKMLQRVIAFRISSGTHGPENVDLVAHLMPAEREDKSTAAAAIVKKYFYNNYRRIRGEDNVEQEYEEGRPPSSANKMVNKDHEEEVVTVDRVWNCQGRLLNNKGRIATRLKDVCLSFSLFKLLRRRYLDYPAEEEGQRDTTKRLVLEELLSANDNKHNLVAEDFILRRHCSRTFRVIQMELGFLYDLFYTKYPLSFYRGVSVLNVLPLLVAASSVWTAGWALQAYEQHGNDDESMWTGNAADVTLTCVFAAIIVVMELWEFRNHVLSNWSKVLLTCDYVRHHQTRDRFHVDKLVAILGCCGTIWKPSSKKMGQYSLFEGYKSPSSDRNISKVFKSFSYVTGAKQSPPVKVTEDTRYAIFRALRDEHCCISNGERALQRNGVYERLSEACNEKSVDRKIMVWHIATTYFEIEMAAQDSSNSKKASKKDNVRAERSHACSHSQVAISLSRYCAYLLHFAADLLPVDNLEVKYLFENVISVAGKFFGKEANWSNETEKMYQKMKDVVPDDDEDINGTILAQGLNLAKELESTINNEETRWKVLAEFWAEFVLYLAPSDNAGAHLQKLSNGGEFITYLWVLLYNAGIIDRPDSASAAV